MNDLQSFDLILEDNATNFLSGTIMLWNKLQLSLFILLNERFYLSVNGIYNWGQYTLAT